MELSAGDSFELPHLLANKSSTTVSQSPPQPRNNAAEYAPAGLRQHYKLCGFHRSAPKGLAGLAIAFWHCFQGGSCMFGYCWENHAGKNKRHCKDVIAQAGRQVGWVTAP